MKDTRKPCLGPVNIENGILQPVGACENRESFRRELMKTGPYVTVENFLDAKPRLEFHQNYLLIQVAASWG